MTLADDFRQLDADLADLALGLTRAMAAYDQMVVRPAQRVGVVDVGEVYRQKEAEFTQMLTKAGSEGERDKVSVLAVDKAKAREVEIVSGLKPQELVLASKFDNLKDGLAVKVTGARAEASVSTGAAPGAGVRTN